MKAQCSSKWLRILFRSVCSIAISMLACGWAIPNSSSPGLAQVNGPCTDWDLARDFRKYPNQENPNRDSCGNLDVWHFMQSADFTRNPQTYSLLPNFENSSSGILGLEKWTGPDWNPSGDGLPEVLMNTTGLPQITDPSKPLFIIPPGAIAAHPSENRFAIVGWKNPLEGNSVVSITGSVRLLNPYFQDGIIWYIDEGTTNLASGLIQNGGSQDFRNGTGGTNLAEVAVNQGDIIYFLIHPNNSFYGDTTQLDIQITPATAPSGIFFRGQTQKGAAGQTVDYQVNLMNLTGGEESFNLSLAGNSWPTSLAPEVLGPIGNGQSENFTLSVTVPQDISGGTTDTVQITATAVHSPTLSKTAVFTTFTKYPPVAGFSTSVADPSRFDEIQFYNNSSDPEGVGIQSANWDFGDGTTASGENVSHRYMADGDYSVQLTVTTSDGRTAATTQTIAVRTHDVMITGFVVKKVPAPGVTGKISVFLVNRNYAETVQVVLYVSSPGGFVQIGSTTQAVPVRKSGDATRFDFIYNYTDQDAGIGKVTFKAVATIITGRDSIPCDNEYNSFPIKVSHKKSY